MSTTMKKTMILSILTILIASGVYAQTEITPIDLKKARHAAYEWVREYCAIEFGNRDGKDRFMRLYESSDVKVFNDYFPMQGYPFENPYVSAQEYAELRNTSKRYKANLNAKDVSIVSEHYSNDGIFHMTVQWTNCINFKPDDTAVTFLRYPDFKIKLQVRLKYNSHNDSGEAVATEMTLNQPAVPPFVMLHIDDTTNLQITKSDLGRNIYSQNTALVRTTYQQCGEDDKFYIIKYDSVKNSIGIALSYGLGTLSTSFANEERVTDNKSNMRNLTVGISYYRQLKLKDKHRLGILVMPSFQSSDYLWELNYSDKLPDIDPDGGPYERRVIVSEYSETLQSYNLSIPITLRYDYFINKNHLSLFGQIGISPSVALSRKTNAYADNEKISGYYDWLFDVELDQSGIYDFGERQMSEYSITGSPFSSFNMEGIVGIGVAYWIPTKQLSLEFSINYRPLLLQKTSVDNDYHLLPHINEWNSIQTDIQRIHHHSINFQLQINYHF